METTEFLAGLKPGDQVIVKHPNDTPADVAIVERLTPTQIVLRGRDARWSRSSGREFCRQEQRAWASQLWPYSAEEEASLNGRFADVLKDENRRGYV